MRLFIAIQLSDEIKKALVGYMHDLKKQGVEGNQKLAAYVKALRPPCPPKKSPAIRISLSPTSP